MATATLTPSEDKQTAQIAVYGSHDIREALKDRGYRFAAGTRDAEFEERFAAGSGDMAHWYIDSLTPVQIVEEWSALRELNVEPGDGRLQQLEANWEQVKAQ